MALPIMEADKLMEFEKRRDFAWASASDAIDFARSAKLQHLRERGIKDALFARRMAHIYQKGARDLRSKLKAKDDVDTQTPKQRVVRNAH